MKRYLLLSILLIAFQLGHAQLYNYENGDTVNDFTVTDVYGNTHNLYSYTAQGKYVYIDFFYSACGSCQMFIAEFNEFYDKYGCNEGEIVCLAINSGYDKDADVIVFENNYGGDFNHAPAVSSDGGCLEVVDDFGPIYYPAVCLIGPDNTMINSNIVPYNSVENLEATFPSGFDPQPMNCTIGFDEVEDSLNYSVYPNPCEGNEINIMFDQPIKAEIKIFNILGRVVFSDIVNGTLNKVKTQLSPGTYFLSIQADSLNKTQKLIVK